MSGEAVLRDEPMDPLNERDVLAAKVCARLKEDERTSYRMSCGLLSPKEVARMAAEVFLEEA